MKTLSAQNKSSTNIAIGDTNINAEIKDVDSNLELPKLKDSVIFCANLNHQWKKYLDQDTLKNKVFDFTNDSNVVYLASLYFTITKSGITELNKNDFYSNPDSVCYKIFLNSLMSLRWYPRYILKEHYKKATETISIVYFRITSKGISCRIVSIRDSETIFECSQIE